MPCLNIDISVNKEHALRPVGMWGILDDRSVCVFVQDNCGVIWIGLARSIAEAKSIALRHPKASQIKNIIIFSQKTLRKMIMRMDGEGPSISEEENLLEA